MVEIYKQINDPYVKELILEYVYDWDVRQHHKKLMNELLFQTNIIKRYVERNYPICSTAWSMDIPTIGRRLTRGGDHYYIEFTEEKQVDFRFDIDFHIMIHMAIHSRKYEGVSRFLAQRIVMINELKVNNSIIQLRNNLG